MKFNIISIDDSRASYKENIRKRVKGREVRIPSVNGRQVNLSEELEKRGLHIPNPAAFSVGEIGIWLSMFDCWQWAVDNDEELITFEDDAIPHPYFNLGLKRFRQELPPDYDFLCLWVPPNQMRDYFYDVTYDDDGQPTVTGTRRDSLFKFGFYLAKCYNGYGNVATLFSPEGAKFFIDRAREAGLYTPVDCYLYQEAHAGRCKGFSPKPIHATVVEYDWPETTVHTTDRFGEVYK